MKFGKGHTKYDEEDDDELKSKIIKNYGYVDKEQYNFSKRLIQEMIERKMKSNQELVDLTGLAKSTISNYVNGKQKPRANELKVLSQKLMLPTDYLLGKVNSRNIKAIDVEDMIGLDYYAQGVLYGLKHNIEEVVDLDEKKPISTLHENKLNIFSAFIGNKPNFESILTYFEGYVSLKQQLNGDTISYGLDTKEETEEKLQENLDVLKVRIMKLLFNNLDYIANNYRKDL